MDAGRIKIVLLALAVLTFSRIIVAVLDKSTFMDMLGWAGPPVFTVFSTILAAWFIIVALGIALVFYDQSTTPLITIAIVIFIALVLKGSEMAWIAIP